MSKALGQIVYDILDVEATKKKKFCETGASANKQAKSHVLTYAHASRGARLSTVLVVHGKRPTCHAGHDNRYKASFP